MGVGIIKIKFLHEDSDQLQGLHFTSARIHGVMLVVAKGSQAKPEFWHYPLARVEYIVSDS